MITEADIDRHLESLEDTDFDQLYSQLVEKHSDYFTQLEEDSELLFDQEVDYLWSLIALYMTLLDSTIDVEKMLELEEVNWQILHDNSRLKVAFDKSFDGYAEEDLLAYLEDSLDVTDEDEDLDFLTKVGRELMFVKVKALIDNYSGKA